MVKLALDVGQAAEDVGVVELQVVQHRRARAVVHEFAALVEKGGVVFIGFDDEKGPFAPCRQAAQPGGDAKVQRHAAHQKARLQARAFQRPGQHGCGAGFAMRAGHGQHVAALQHVFGQPLRPAGVGQARVENGFHQREFGRAICQPRAADHVANHEHVGLERQLIGAVAFHQINAQRAQLLAHGRVNACVAAGDGVPGLARQRRQPAHESAADAKDVDVHEGFAQVSLRFRAGFA